MQRCACERGEIGAIVHDKPGVRLAAQFGDALQLRKHFAREKSFVTELENFCSALDNLCGRSYGINAVPRGDFRVQNWIELRQHAKAPGPRPECRARRNG